MHEAEALLVRLTRERDEQHVVCQRATLALHQAKREAQRLVRERSSGNMRSAPPHLAACEWAKVDQVQARLAALVGTEEAAAVAADSRYTPAVLRER